jgi:hypothetical protein
MKSILLALTLVFISTATFAAAETKKVCVEQKDPKTNKPKQVCKDVKVHKKLEGTEVPAKK